jgi:hypothetical protein
MQATAPGSELDHLREWPVIIWRVSRPNLFDLLGPAAWWGGRTITFRDKLACPRKQLLAAGHKSVLPLIFDP